MPNELTAYRYLTKLQAHFEALRPRAATNASYALCRFANLSSIAMEIGSIEGIAPVRRNDLAKLGVGAIPGGLLVTRMNGALAGSIAA